MTDTTARKVANTVIGAAGVAAAYVVITSPPLRRLALRSLRYYLGPSVPAYLAFELARAWRQSAPAKP